MLQIILSLTFGILVGWNFHIFFISLEPKIAPEKLALNAQEFNIPSLEKKSIIEAKKPKEIGKSPSKLDSNSSDEDSFQTLLSQNNFTDAMALYLEGTSEEVHLYKLILKTYFYDNAVTNPKTTIEQILYYIEIEPEHRDVKFYLVEIYKNQFELEKAIKLLFELHHNYLNEEEQKKITDNLKITIETHLLTLKKLQDFSKLILFLEEIIDYNINSEPYLLTLAQLYFDLHQYEKAETIIEELKYSTIYGLKAQAILDDIIQERSEKSLYRYKVPLVKLGSHYGIHVSINNIQLTLILDTGASYTFIDEDKVPSLKIIQETLLLTAGGTINAQIAMAESFTIDEIILEDFKLTVAPFKQGNADGLLGMNFFEKFKFLIDQEESMLYLSVKS